MGATITGKGQITIPVAVRRALGLKPGMRVSFVETRTGSYEMVPETGTIKSLKGAIKAPAKPVSLEQMDAAIGEGAVESLGR
ncbi:MAG: AbrB/MazE/SpoVT family DNA-binding domain-containing protein [Stackebrandtia sp.]